MDDVSQLFPCFQLIHFVIRVRSSLGPRDDAPKRPAFLLFSPRAYFVYSWLSFPLTVGLVAFVLPPARLYIFFSFSSLV